MISTSTLMLLKALLTAAALLGFGFWQLATLRRLRREREARRAGEQPEHDDPDARQTEISASRDSHRQAATTTAAPAAAPTAASTAEPAAKREREDEPEVRETANSNGFAG